MLVIRLARVGRAKYPTYRIVAAESARAATGKFIEQLGHYNPHTKEIVLHKESIEKRLSHGAQPSNSVAKLLQKEGIKMPEWVEIKSRDRKPKKEPVAKVEAPAAEVVEASAETAEVTESTEAEPVVAQAAQENTSEVEASKAPADAAETAETTEAAAEASAEASDTAAENAEETAAAEKTE